LQNQEIPTFEEHLSNIEKIDEAWKISKLMHLWEKNLSFGSQKNMSEETIVPQAPHIVDCEALQAMYEQFDKRNLFGQRPKWPLWKGHLHWHSSWNENKDIERGESLLGNTERLIMGPFPPWVFTLRLLVHLFYFCSIILFSLAIQVYSQCAHFSID
jgi:hypothetical protein